MRVNHISEITKLKQELKRSNSRKFNRCGSERTIEKGQIYLINEFKKSMNKKLEFKDKEISKLKERLEQKND